MRQIPFTSLLLTALVPEGKFKDKQGVIVTLPPLHNGNIYLLFKADKSDFQTKYLKEILNKESTPRCCDIICFALQKSPDQHNKSKRKITICLGELKDGKQDYLSEASNQILETRDGLEKGIQRYFIDKEWKNIIITWQALIITQSSLPKNDIKENADYQTLHKRFNGNVKYVKYKDKTINLIEYIDK